MTHNSNTTSRKVRRVRWGTVKTYYHSDPDAPHIGCFSTVALIGYPQLPPIEHYATPDSQLSSEGLLERRRLVFEVLAYDGEPPPPAPALRVIALPEDPVRVSAVAATTYTRRSYFASNQTNNTYTTSTTGGNTPPQKRR